MMNALHARFRMGLLTLPILCAMQSGCVCWRAAQPGAPTSAIAVPPAGTAGRAGPSAAQLGVGASLAELGLRLLRSPQESGNRMVSPYSVGSSLALLHAGAAGATAAEMAAIVYPAAVGEQAPLRAALAQLSRAGTIVGGAGIDWRAGQHIWLDHAAASTLRPPFLETAMRDYGTGASVLKLSDAPMAEAAINAWAAQQTAGKIEMLVPAGGLPANTELVLTNAVYFKGKWKQSFNPSYTQPAPFRNGDGGIVEVPTMAGTVAVREGTAEHYQLIELPYADDQFAMLIVMPRGANEVLPLDGALTGSRLLAWRSALQETTVDVRLPRFAIAARSASAKQALQQTGMRQAFGNGADFSPMFGNSRIKLSDIYHAAGIEVDEQGSEAVAATAAVAQAKSLSPRTHPLRKIDRPFLFVLIHAPTATPLFLGVVSALAGTAHVPLK